MVLYPIDLAKTLKQAGPASKGASLATQARAYGFWSLWAGLTPAILGSMPSSALYFGVYEHMKRRLNAVVPSPSTTEEGKGNNKNALLDLSAQRAQVARRWLVHAVAAAAGNTASSLVFVPKEVLKQQLQTFRNSHSGVSANTLQVLGTILKEKGIIGLYSGYRATLLRNIPSAILRFALYEEFKIFIAGHSVLSTWLQTHHAPLVAGAFAGAISSAMTTPLDVVKTRMAVNACPPGGHVLTCLVDVAQREGVPGLYAGLGFRVLYSALFTAVGFTSFEAAKVLMGVADPVPKVQQQQEVVRQAGGGGRK